MARNENKDIASHNQAIKRNPSLTHPWAKDPEGNGFVWIHINARKILDQYSKAQGAIRVKTGAPEVQYAFLAPLAMTETVAHNWAEYESMSSRLAQKVRTAAKIGAEYRGLVDSFRDNANEQDKLKGILKNKSALAGQGVANFLQGVYNRVSPHSIPKKKVDTPLYYENSNRRNLTFEVLLVAEKDPRFDVVEPIKDLMKFSSPNLLGRGGVDIEFPYMFEVYTRPKEWIRYSTLALTAVQPTYNQPYIGGYPSNAILQLTFIDLSPLYRGAIESGSVISVIKSGESKAREAQGDNLSNHELWKLRQKAGQANTTASQKTSTTKGKGGSGDPDRYKDIPVGGTTVGEIEEFGN